MGKRKRRAPEPPPEPERPLRPLTVEVDGQRIEEALSQVEEEVRYWANRGLDTKVRLRFRGKQVLPDIPFAAFLAAEAATLWTAGLLRALIVNLGGRALLDVEIISSAEPHLAVGKEHLLRGDIDDALSSFEAAAAADRSLAAAHLNIGVCRKLRGEPERATPSFVRAADLDPDGEVGRQAREQLRKLTSARAGH